MLAANIWHWWIGVVLALTGVGAVLGLVIGGVPGHRAGREHITTCLAGPGFEIRPGGDRHLMEFERDSE